MNFIEKHKILLVSALIGSVLIVVSVSVWLTQRKRPTRTQDLLLPGKFYASDTPFQRLDCEAAFQGLTKSEKLYAHYISRASWEGHFISMIQTSPEAPLIFIFLDRILRIKPTVVEMKNYLKSAHSFSNKDVTALLVFASAFMSNGGNYRGFGDSKFIPDVPIEKLISVAKEIFGDEFSFFDKNCIEPMMYYGEEVRLIGFRPHGVNTYWSSNCNHTDARRVMEFLKHKKLDAYNHRVIKTPANSAEGGLSDVYEIRFASSQSTNDPDTTVEQLIGKQEEFEGYLYRFTRGDYSTILSAVVENLKNASQHTFDQNQSLMLKEYGKYFEAGSLQAHKNGSRYWIKDKGPSVESYIGFIETYRDPAGARAAFEGFVAVVNKDESEKLGGLVNSAESIIKTSMPWPKEFEKDVYLRPDFTSLDIIAFAGDGVPSGINIPNYNEIRQNEGFKNVQLRNAIIAKDTAAKINHLSPEDLEQYKKYRDPAYEVQVALHELLGHGSGKLFEQYENGTYNFDQGTINPLTGEKVSSFYRPGETFESVFASVGSSYEECRAECIGLYLSTHKDVPKIFQQNISDADSIVYVNWLSMVLSGIRGLEVYDSGSKKWGQAHAQARFVILRVLLEEAHDLLDIQMTTNKEDGKPDLLVSLNRSAISTSGKKVIGDFLKKLQVYKSTADVNVATEMYQALSEVKEDSPSRHNFIKIREIVLDRKTPRTVLVQSNTRIDSQSGEVELLSYEGSPEGFAQSWIDRYPEPQRFYNALMALYKKDYRDFVVERSVR